MKLFEGKTPSERNKMIAAAVLGVISLVALYFAFGRSMFGSSTTSVTVKTSTSPTPVAPTAGNRADSVLPSVSEQNFLYQTTPVVYSPGLAGAPDAGRNIFAFYEPPPPCLDCPAPIVPQKPSPPSPPPPLPSPVPTPPIFITAVPQTVFAGSKAFRLDVSGNEFPANARIYFNQNEMPTTFVNAQRLFTEIPANFITQEGPRQIIVQTPDGKIYSNQVMLSIQAPPKPGLQYIGMIARKRFNNDTAYFIEPGNDKPIGRRLNDVVSGRFRLVDISAKGVVFEDVNLGFRHQVALTTTVAAAGPGGRLQNESGFGSPQPGVFLQQAPGMPNMVPNYVQPQPPSRPPQSNRVKKLDEKDDVDDNDGPR